MPTKNAVRSKRVGPGRLSAEETAQLPERLLDAALAVFSERGFAGATMDQIAKAAGASTKTIYARYSDKTEILKAVIRRIVNRTVEAHMREAPMDVTQTDLREFLIGLCTQISIRISTEAAKLNQFAMAEVHRVPELKRLHQESQARGASLISEALAVWHRNGMIRNLAPADFQRAGVLCLSMATDWTRIRTSLHDAPSRKEIDDYVAFALDIFLHGIGFQPEAAAAKPRKRG
jgi:TetR/AcrR family transcriptional regulator, mexJK operon transcriptional repressor